MWQTGANSSGAGAPFLDLNLSITDGIVSSKIYDKRGDFNFEIVNFPFLDGDVPRSPSCGVCVSLLIGFAGVCSGVNGFNNKNLLELFFYEKTDVSPLLMSKACVIEYNFKQKH